MTRTLPINLGGLYLSKKIETDSFTKLLADNNPSVIFRMYYIANGVKERQVFLELNNTEEYSLIAAVYTKSNLKGDAKDQISAVSIKNRMIYTPHYRVRVILTHKKTGNEVFDFEHITSSEREIYNLIPVIKNKIDNLLWIK